MMNRLRRLCLALMLCMGVFFTPVTAYALADGGAASASSDPEAVDNSTAFTPDGQGTVLDNTGDSDKEFFTFSTPNGSIFYLIIDRAREGENVYFLNTVTESDLMALAEKEDSGVSESAVPVVEVCTCTNKCEAGAVDPNCSVCMRDLTACAGVASTQTVDPKPDASTPQKSGGGAMIFVLLLAVAVGGVGYYLKIYKPKHDLDGAEDLDDVLGDDDEPEVNEDEMEANHEADMAAYDDYPGDGEDEQNE